MKKLISVILCGLLIVLLPEINVKANNKVILTGDANFDGTITSDDARTMLRISVGIDNFDKSCIKYLDIDRDGVITAADARAVLRISIGLSGNTVIPINAEIIAYSEKDYPIYTLNGITYIDGIIIANKTYSLPSNYNPGSLTPECQAAFDSMRKDAAKKGLNLYINSAFRSYSYQESLYNRYVARDGKRLADTYSARPGHSEHQTGLSLDLNTVTQSFANTEEGRWVAAHCHEYGFIIRYPKGKTDITGYCYEPWHLRYVGIDKASEITNSEMCLEEFYGITSVYA